jgi:hypothetical protein
LSSQPKTVILKEMIKKIALIPTVFLGLICLYLCLPSPIQAAKKRPHRGWKQPKTATKTTTRTTTTSSTRGTKASVRFRPDRRGIYLNLSWNNDNFAAITYMLTYTTNGLAQGAGGSVIASTAGQQRELLFATCSAGVCRWHTNIKNARLVIETKLKSGVTIRKPFRLKV